MAAYYVVKDDNSASVFGGPAVNHETLGWVAPCVQTFTYCANGEKTSADAIEKANKLAAELNAKVGA